ncbi:MAG: arginine decarboxylase, pyruvoyl-dependent [candidate division Zixibacteria bacterium]|nr:arginine decarboxylase, pyruvoyl-dependent [candidate division Zixibacteria bacterium]
MIVAKEIFLTKGVGRHRERLSSFELALRDAGIAHFNLVTVSSILPPHCRVISRQAGLRKMTPGQIAFVVMSRNDTSEPSRLISATIGLAIPKDPSQVGYLTEHHDYGMTERRAGEYAEDLAATMLATSLGLDFDVDKSWDENKEEWKISGKIYRTRNSTQSATGDKNGLWTSVVAAAVMITD